MRKMSSRNSRLVGFLPTQTRPRVSQLQYSLNAVRCQRTTVSGWISIKAFRHPAHNRRRAIQQKRWGKENRGWGWRLAKTASCWRRARFSKRRSRREREEQMSTTNISLRICDMGGLHHRKYNGIRSEKRRGDPCVRRFRSFFLTFTPQK